MNEQREIEIQLNLICGLMLGIEHVVDEGWNSIIIDILFVRTMISWN